MGGNLSHEPPEIDPEGVSVLMYEWAATSNSFVNSASAHSSKSLSDAKSPHCTSIVAFGCEYYFDSSGIVTLYEPGGLHKVVSKDPLKIANFCKSPAEWESWIADQSESAFHARTFDFETHNWNHFTLDAARFFGLDLSVYPDFVDILEEPKKMKKKMIAGAVKSAAVTSKFAVQIPNVAAGNPASTHVINALSAKLHDVAEKIKNS